MKPSEMTFSIDNMHEAMGFHFKIEDIHKDVVEKHKKSHSTREVQPKQEEIKHEKSKVQKHYRKHKTERSCAKLELEHKKDKAKFKTSKRASVSVNLNEENKSKVYEISKTETIHQEEPIQLEDSQNSTFNPMEGMNTSRSQSEKDSKNAEKPFKNLSAQSPPFDISEIIYQSFGFRPPQFMLNMMTSKNGEEFNPPQFMVNMLKAKVKDGFTPSPEILELINSQDRSGIKVPSFLVELVRDSLKQKPSRNE